MENYDLKRQHEETGGIVVAVKAKKNRKSLYIIVALLVVGIIFAIVMVLQNERIEEESNLQSEQIEEESSPQSEQIEEEMTFLDDNSAEVTNSYKQFCEYIDQGDAKSAVTALLESQAAEEVYVRLHTEDTMLMESILEEAACFYNEDGELFNIMQLRLKGFLTDEMFCRYWERVGTEIPAAISDEADQSSYDAYLFQELLSWYERGEQAVAQIIDLRYVGMIEDELYSALVEEWNVDIMDAVDSDNYIPLYGMYLTENEKRQIRDWQIYVDEGNSCGVAEMVLNGEITENTYRWLQKNDAKLVDMLLAQAMFEFTVNGDYEQSIRLILTGFVSDECFERYWDLLEFAPVGDKRSHEDYQGVDMYLVYEVERICALENDPAVLQWLWKENLIDEYTFDLLVGRGGCWESD